MPVTGTVLVMVPGAFALNVTSVFALVSAVTGCALAPTAKARTTVTAVEKWNIRFTVDPPRCVTRIVAGGRVHHGRRAGAAGQSKSAATVQICRLGEHRACG